MSFAIPTFLLLGPGAPRLRRNRRRTDVAVESPADLVAHALDRLSVVHPDWTVVSTPSHRRLDHVVVGPTGVYALLSRRHELATVQVDGTSLTVDGTPHPYLLEARHEGQILKQRLAGVLGDGVPVTGVVVLVRSHLDLVAAPPSDVIVTPRLNLVRTMLGGAPVIDNPDRVVEAVRTLV